MTIDFGPTQPFSQEIHSEKYRSPGESFREGMSRVASGLADNPEHYHEFRDILLNMRFLPGGRIQTSIGAAKEVTSFNCFVSGSIADSFVDGPSCIMDAAKEAAATMRMGGGIGYDFSPLRPKKDPIHKLQSFSSGPVSFMGIFDAVCKTVASSGHRRGAQMGMLRVDHPDIMEFIDAKTDRTTLTGFNISVAVTDAFMEALAAEKPFALQFGGRTYREVDPRHIWEKLMRNTWDWAEPGVIFIDAVNRENNLRYCETLAATNPCGEQPLPPYGACLLGSFNLVQFVVSQPGGTFSFDMDRLCADIPHVVRAMDNVVDKSLYPLPQQKVDALNKRRMGLGVTGLANTVEALGMPYGSKASIDFTEKVLDTIARETYRAGALLAKEKGPFPLYRERPYLAKNGRFVSRHFHRLGDQETLDLIKEHGIRNSHYLSIAPTGTISLAADNVSSGIEPVFSLSYDRVVQHPDGQKIEQVVDYGHRVFGVKGKVSADVTVDEHIAMHLAASKRVDSAVSKTCNVPPTTPWEAFKSIYLKVWEGGGKGCSTFNSGGKRSGILVAKEAESDLQTGEACRIDPKTGIKSCDS